MTEKKKVFLAKKPNCNVLSEPPKTHPELLWAMDGDKSDVRSQKVINFQSFFELYFLFHFKQKAQRTQEKCC